MEGWSLGCAVVFQLTSILSFRPKKKTQGLPFDVNVRYRWFFFSKVGFREGRCIGSNNEIATCKTPMYMPRDKWDFRVQALNPKCVEAREVGMGDTNKTLQYVKLKST